MQGQVSYIYVGQNPKSHLNTSIITLNGSLNGNWLLYFMYSCCFLVINPENPFLFQVEAEKGFCTSSKQPMLRDDWTPDRTLLSVCDLQITEPEDHVSPLVKDASTSFSPAEGRMEAFETHI